MKSLFFFEFTICPRLIRANIMYVEFLTQNYIFSFWTDFHTLAAYKTQFV